MKATGLLLLLLAVFIFINAANIRDVFQGKLKFSFIGNTPKVGTDTKAREG